MKSTRPMIQELCVYLLAKANSGMIKHQYMKTIIKLTHRLWINTEEKGIKTNVINNIEDIAIVQAILLYQARK